tara:strand:+ start:415 stop:729 length:315 start_codon:yes stop_codon:yes gene_type:complete
MNLNLFKMNRITEDQVKKVAVLARLRLDNNQVIHHAEQIEKILDYINQLEKIDTTGVPCTTRAIEVVNVLRTDINNKFEDRDELLNLAPSRENDFFKVPKIVKS